MGPAPSRHSAPQTASADNPSAIQKKDLTSQAARFGRLLVIAKPQLRCARQSSPFLRSQVNYPMIIMRFLKNLRASFTTSTQQISSANERCSGGSASQRPHFLFRSSPVIVTTSYYILPGCIRGLVFIFSFLRFYQNRPRTVAVQ